MIPTRLLWLSALAALWAFSAVAPAKAGLLDSIKDRVKEEAREKAEEKARETEDEAKAKAEQTASDATHAVQEKAQETAEEPSTPAKPENDTTPAAPAESSPPTATSAPDVSNNQLPTAPPGPLPPASQFTLVLSSAVAEDTEHTPIDPGQEFSCYAAKIYAAVTNLAKTNYSVGARLVPAEGPPTAATATASPLWNEFTPDFPKLLLELALPESGVRPGNYRLELLEAADPHRVIATVPIKLVVPPPAPADAFQLTLTSDVDHLDDYSAQPQTEFSAGPEKMFLMLTTTGAALDFTAQIVVEEAEGLKPNTRLGGPPPETRSVSETAKRAYVELLVPGFGLPKGRYRVEVVEAHLPHRVIKTTTFTTKAPTLEPGAPFNLADVRYGGLIESINDEDGAGITWAAPLLVAGNTDAWSPFTWLDADGNPPPNRLKSPCEIVVSFYQHISARVSTVELTGTDSTHAPRRVEIWGSKDTAQDGFVRLGEVTAANPEQLTLSIPSAPTEVRFVKIRILEANNDTGELQLNGLRVIESAQPGYRPLAKRIPAVLNWALQPRRAAQSGLFYLQSKSVAWQQGSSCLGCHVQAQTLMGISIARENDYVVSGAAERFLSEFIAKQKFEDPAVDGASRSVFASFGLAYSRRTPETDAKLISAAEGLASIQSEEGGLSGEGGRPPIEQGEIMYTASAIKVWTEALATKPNPKLESARKRAIAFVAQAEAVTTQDKVFKILTLAQWGDEAQKKLARQLCVQLQSEQTNDGGWLTEADTPKGPSAYATGQVLYAMRVAGLRPTTPAFQRGVQFLLGRQQRDGSWRDAELSTPFAATMWPVIALAGAFGTRVEPAHIVVSSIPRQPPPPPKPAPPPVALPAPAAKAELPKNIELILDCSFSMNDRLGKSTRLATAKQVLRDVISRLPNSINVGLRFYGHRFDSMSRESAKDTQLVFPIQPLDRAAMIKLIDGVSANGQTPLVFSTLQAAEDLKKLGGGAIILVTDGEESCGGKPRKAGPQIAAMGLPIRLDIVGFTITGKRVTEDLVAFASATGGRYTTAADAVQLAAALAEATSPTALAAPPAPPPPPPVEPPPAPKIEDFRYDIFNDANEKIATSSTLSGDTPDLEPGVYRVVLHDGGKDIVLTGIKVDASDTRELRYTPDTGAFEKLSE